MIAGFVIVAPAAQAAPQVTPEIARLFQLTNEARTARGLSPLKLDTRLTEIAQDWSQTQARDGRMYHRPNFTSVYPAGWQFASENVAYGSQGVSADTIFDAWMKSPGHYANIMHSSTTHIGIGWSGNGRNNYATQNFGQFRSDPSPVLLNPGGGTVTPPSAPAPNSVYHLTNNLTAYSQVATSFQFGNPGEEFFVGDWDGDGKDSIAIRRGNVFHFTNGTNGRLDFTFAYGNPGDTILVGDWNGDGKDTLGVRRGNTFHLKNSFSGGNADIVFAYGDAWDAIIVGDWDGDGRDTLGVRRGNTYHLKNSFVGGNADVVFAYGDAWDDIVVGDWNGDGKDTMTVRRGNVFHVKNSFTGGGADVVARFGDPGDLVFVGDWNGDGKDTVGVRK